MFCYSGLDLDLLRNGKCQIECEASEDSCAWRTLSYYNLGSWVSHTPAGQGWVCSENLL